ncbi:hypothetical protein AN958_06119 [Leucoagaricus sp. SymC.cos]|nr:hypothetical protein AN958_06119 [Leucoagaricus sp. SymC.cos]
MSVRFAPGTTSTFNHKAFERIDKNDAALLIIDHQVGLFQMVKDFTPAEFRNNILAHASLGKLFNLPVILTTSTESVSLTLVIRRSEQSLNPRYVLFICQYVCTTFSAMSLRGAGYTVYGNADASGTSPAKAAEDAKARMRSAGIHVYSTFAIVCDLTRDRRNKPGASEALPWPDR